ncbi:MAG: Spy/CpxP family protein refolding chaperone [Gemmatimonadota bacterium]|nr:MAG: Spy/CpxP family protein refolding chaperone [Gemmatimonadota bacterium]
MRAVTRVLPGVAVAAVLLIGVLPAQEPEAAPDTRPRRMRLHEPGTGLQGGPAMRQRIGMAAGELAGVRAFSPQALIQRKDFLGLTEEQVARLEQLGEELQGVHDQAVEEARSSHEALREAWQADQPDAEAVRRYARQAMEAHQAAQLAMVGSAAQAKALLSPEQQGKMQGWMEGRRQGGQMRGSRPGMRHGWMGHRQHSPRRRP